MYWPCITSVLLIYLYRYVNIVKKALKKSRDPFLNFAEIHNCPVDRIASPAQCLLMSRWLRSTLPTTPAQLSPKVVNQTEVYKRFYGGDSAFFILPCHNLDPFYTA